MSGAGTSDWYVSNVTTENDFVPSLTTVDGARTSGAKHLLNNRQLGVGVNAWQADPGVYQHPGGPLGETFVVVEGTATFRVGNADAVDIAVGSVVSIPPNTPTQMTVSRRLSKVSLNFSAVPVH